MSISIPWQQGELPGIVLESYYFIKIIDNSMVMIDVIRHYCPLILAKDQMHHICFWALLDYISTHTTPHRPRECFYLEHRSLSLEVMHWILGTKFWIQVILRPISESACAFTPGLSSKWPEACFQSTWAKLGHVGNWSTSMFSMPSESRMKQWMVRVYI